jgi:hypothetical protein
MAKAMTAVMVAMTGSRIIWRSWRNSCNEARRIAFPVGFVAAIGPPFSLGAHKSTIGVVTKVQQVEARLCGW